jgi:hypothetical protein
MMPNTGILMLFLIGVGIVCAAIWLYAWFAPVDDKEDNS